MISKDVGIAQATLFNGLVTLVGSLALYYYAQTQTGLLPESFRAPTGMKLSWWYLLTGTIGLTLVAGIPFAFAKFGAMRTTILLITGQLVVSTLWDRFFEQIPLAPNKIVAIILSIISVFLSTKNF